MPTILDAITDENFGAKNTQNFWRFYTTSDFNREHLRDQSRYPNSKIEKINDRDRFLLHYNFKKSGKLLSTNYKV